MAVRKASSTGRMGWGAGLGQEAGEQTGRENGLRSAPF